MTEKELRKKYISGFEEWNGLSRAKGTHKPIIDLYNSNKPLPRGYKVSYTDAYCATTTSAAAIKAGLKDIFPIECSCSRVIELAKKMGIWVENDAFVPDVGDLILYDWDDDGKGDDTGAPEHIGAVVSVSNKIIKVIEGNKGGNVGYREIPVNGKYIRGFVTPKYSSKATKSTKKTTTTTKKEEVKAPTLSFSEGDLVSFTGSVHYKSSGSGTGYGCKAGKAKVTATQAGAVHPYHLKAVAGKGSTVYGWVNAADVKAYSSNKLTYTVKAGDTLSSIAAKYGTTVENLVKLNGIKDKNKIYKGQILQLK